MLSIPTEYARAMAHLAAHDPDFHAIAAIATATRIAPTHLQKFVCMLRSVRLVVTDRARGGGAKLARTPASITLLDVVNALGSLERSDPGVATLAALNPRLDALVCDLEQRLARVTLADVAVRREEQL